jgi:hypothetical protein
MRLIIEGPDNSGKSTLAEAIADYMGMPIQESEGPPRSEGEINDRVDRYERNKDTFIFVRHPIISDPIYATTRGEESPISIDRILEFYNSKPVFVYCDPLDRGLKGHKVKNHDSPGHLNRIDQHYSSILFQYRVWAARNAHFIYRIGDDTKRLIQTLWFYKCYGEELDKPSGIRSAA